MVSRGARGLSGSRAPLRGYLQFSFNHLIKTYNNAIKISNSRQLRINDIHSEAGRQVAIQRATELHAAGQTELTMLTRLRKEFPHELATSAVELVQLRTKASAKFERASEMYFTREALEIASGEVVSRYRAKRFAPYAIVGDLGCGIGGDALGLASVGCTVEAIDRDPDRLTMTQRNAEVYGLQDRIHTHCLDLLTDPLPPMNAAFADPARRAGGQRYLSIRDYLPPPLELMQRFPKNFPLAFKLAPGISREDLADLPGEIEFIEVSGELKECVVWLGPLQTCNRRATLLPTGDSLTGDANVYPPESRTIGAYLYDPVPSVVRADLVGTLAEQLNAEPIDAGISVLTSDELTPTPFAKVYRVEEVLTMDRKKLIACLRTRGIGRITLVKSGAGPVAEDVVKGIHLEGDQHRIVFATKQLGKPVAVLCERV